MNLYNPGPHNYSHGFNGKPVIIPSQHVIMGLSEREMLHCQRHNKSLARWMNAKMLEYGVDPETMHEGVQQLVDVSKQSTEEFPCDQCDKVSKSKVGALSHAKTHLNA